MFFIEGKCSLTEKQLIFLQYVLSSEFPWFYCKEKNYDQSTFWFLIHSLMHRNESYIPITGNVNSPHYGICIEIFKSFCAQHNIKANTIFRAALNSTLHSSFGRTRIHTDHDFEHKNFILYINEFNDGQTCIFDNNDNLIKQVEPELHKAMVFSGEPHAHNLCSANQRRVVLLITFN